MIQLKGVSCNYVCLKCLFNKLTWVCSYPAGWSCFFICRGLFLEDVGVSERARCLTGVFFPGDLPVDFFPREFFPVGEVTVAWGNGVFPCEAKVFFLPADTFGSEAIVGVELVWDWTSIAVTHSMSWTMRWSRWERLDWSLDINWGFMLIVI